MLPHQLEKAVAENWPLLVPAGCVEFHGYHLALGTDTIFVEELCHRVAEKTDCVIAPTFDYGVTGYALTGPEAGTIDVDGDHFYHLAKDVLRNFWEMGFGRIYVIIWHQGIDGPEALALRKAATELTFEKTREERGRGWWGREQPEPATWSTVRVSSAVLPAAAEAGVRGDHAGKYETSLLMYLRPNLVDLGQLSRGPLWYCERPENLAVEGSAEYGEELMTAMAEAWVDELRREQ